MLMSGAAAAAAAARLYAALNEALAAAISGVSATLPEAVSLTAGGGVEVDTDGRRVEATCFRR